MFNRDPRLALPYEDLAQQNESAQLGIWIFLATEVLFFGGLFTAYIVYRVTYPNAFAEAGRLTQLWAGAVNTAILLTSSFTMALAVQEAKKVKESQRPQTRRLSVLLAVTVLLGGLFLIIKAIEYSIDYQEHLIPALRFGPFVSQAREVQLFFCLYFIMTLIHALHLTIGLIGITYLAFRARIEGHRGHPLSQSHETQIELMGLYWHFVDIVWVFIFPMLYLVKG